MKLLFILILFTILSSNLYSVEYYDESFLKSEYSDKNIEIDHNLILKLGAVFPMGLWGDNYNTAFPYIGIAWKGIQLRNSHFYFEAELGYFLMKGTTESMKPGPMGKMIVEKSDIDSHAFPLTLSLTRPIELSSNLILTPKAGLGWMFFYSSTTDVKNGFKNFFITKAAIELRYKLNDFLDIMLDQSAIISFDIDLSYYYKPSIGIAFKF